MFRRAVFGVAALAAATLLLESTLTRLLAVAQFYHFAFLVVSLALLGFGASGTLLSLSSRLRALPLERLLPWSGIGFALSVVLAYAVINWLPFDSYSIAWERRQILYFVLYYLALTLPFLWGGLGIGAALAASEGRSHLVYAANLLGSAVGVLLAPAFLGLVGVPGAVLASALVGLLPAVYHDLGGLAWRSAAKVATPPLTAIGGASANGHVPAKASSPSQNITHSPSEIGGRLAALALVAGLAGLIALATLNLGDRGPLGMMISPYKGLSNAWRFPGSSTIFGRWSAISRVDVVANAGTHLLPGLSYAYAGLPPPQGGLSLDADSLQPVTLVHPEAFDAAAFMPEAIAFKLRPGAHTLVLEPGGGLGLLQALAGGATGVTAVVSDPLVRRAVASTNPSDPYSSPRVSTVLESARTYLRNDRKTYDVVYVPLTDAYRPVTSGAYSLAETYSLTVEAFEDALARLSPDGVLVVTRWLQTPPSEDLRAIATLVEALKRRGVADPARALAAYRGIQTVTALVKPAGWTPEELASIREFAQLRRYDPVWLPDIRPDEVNRFNRMPTPQLFEAVQALLGMSPEGRAQFYAAYPFAVAPATDDRPFFFHFFRWGQTPRVLATLGRTWQPFGGSGYFVLFALLALVLLFSGGLIIAPLAIRSRATIGTSTPGLRVRVLLYFALLGIAFLFVEIPLIQRWILLLGHPTYAFTAVVLTILLFSSIGSALARSPRLPKRVALGLLVLLALLAAIAGPYLSHAVLGWPLLPRTLAAIAGLAPLALLMGLPFPFGLAWLETAAPRLTPWAWAVNGCASVIASVLAAILALSYGFTAVLLLGAGAYAVAGVVLPPWGGHLGRGNLAPTGASTGEFDATMSRRGTRWE